MSGLPLREMNEAIDRAWRAIARATAAQASRDAVAGDAHADLSIVLWQLGDSDEARSRIAVDEMVAALRRGGVNDDLPRLAILLAA